MKTKLSLILLAGMFLTACGASVTSVPNVVPPTVQAATVEPPTIQTPIVQPSQALSGEVKISIAGFAFDPAAITITTGTTVTWTNKDSAAHTVTGDDGSWGSNDLATGASFSHTFTKAGSYAYHCGVHPSMIATITVVAP
jgi:plastocyanin